MYTAAVEKFLTFTLICAAALAQVPAGAQESATPRAGAFRLSTLARPLPWALEPPPLLTPVDVFTTYVFEWVDENHPEAALIRARARRDGHVGFAADFKAKNIVEAYGSGGRDIRTGAFNGDHVVDVRLLQSENIRGLQTFGLIRMQNAVVLESPDDQLNWALIQVSVQPGIGMGFTLGDLKPGTLTMKWAVTTGSWFRWGEYDFRPIVNFSHRVEWSF